MIVQISVECVSILLYRDNRVAAAARQPVIMPSARGPTGVNRFKIPGAALANQFRSEVLLNHGIYIWGKVQASLKLHLKLV